MNLNKTLYYGDFVACPAAICGLAVVALLPLDLTTIGIWLLAFIAGCAAWTLVEYMVHRWVYHQVRYFDKMHDAHHQEPMSLIGAPSFFSIGLIFLLFYAPLYLVGQFVAGGFTSGVLLGYLGYMLVHHASHHWTLKPGDLLYGARMRHMVHHFHKEEGNFGVSTGFWDRAFSTYIEPVRQKTS